MELTRYTTLRVSKTVHVEILRRQTLFLERTGIRPSVNELLLRLLRLAGGRIAPAGSRRIPASR